jgi:hypothetical protein
VKKTVIPAPTRLRQEEQRLEASLGRLVRPCLKKTKAEITDVSCTLSGSFTMHDFVIYIGHLENACSVSYADSQVWTLLLLKSHAH